MNKKQLRKKLALMLANLKKKRPFYTEVEYLESTGTQYIDTGVDIGAEVELEFSFYATAFNGSTYCSPLSARRTNQINSISYAFNNGMTYASFGNYAEVQISPTITLNTKHVIIQNKDGLWQDGNKTDYAQGYNTNFTEMGHLYVFARNNIGSSVGNYFIGRIYYSKIYDNGVLIRDLIPVLGWDGKGYMYDKVSGQLFGNAGTGDFVAGRQIHPVEYLESTGTQYIDTDTTFQVTDEVYFKGAILTNANDKFVLSAQPWNDNNNRYSPLGYFSNMLVCAFGNISTAGSYYTPKVNNPEVHTITYKNKVFTMEDTGATYDGSNLTFGGETGKIKLFYGYNAPSVARIYAYKQWRDGELICDFIPIVDELGVGAMFDRVTHTIYDNAGTGQFIPASYQLDGNGRVVEPEYE